MTTDNSARFSVSTWSLHRTIGLCWWDAPGRSAKSDERWGTGEIAMRDLPAALADNGYARLHLCHFHLESRSPAFLKELRAALDAAHVTLGMLLIDDGDITDPAHHERDSAWVAGWVDTAAQLGAQHARVIAGKQPPSAEALALSVRHLSALSDFASHQGVSLCTENWFDLTPGPNEVLYLLDRVSPTIDLLTDFGNWTHAGKYRDLETLLRRAIDTHAKAHFDTVSGMDTGDYRACIAACEKAGYRGPFTLIYDGPDADEWAGLAAERAFIQDCLALKR
ncbi:sugar phosphate isomerase/epimerase family protein [Pelagibacterium xiamenense]|uniref:sugar phosphate isomerase/epimerase family protein n=1 Tax=Pelagibacterium xiamenense TaxID=2901140 RepID=UPI001E44D055|nr:TIM barrel protein [Pelagibacterium xiamenense]MCD7060747.1 sugar phosphate isomerase/epimerase [Pelagibacterium xiamenense]